MSQLYVTILAGGIGKRMGGLIPKVLVKIEGEAMIVKLLKQVIGINPDKIIIVVGKFYHAIREEIEKHIQDNRIVYSIQENALGTGDAIKSTLDEVENNVDNIILNGDVPMIKARTINQIYQEYLKQKVNLIVTCIQLDDPTGSGRIIKDLNDNFVDIVEEKDCTPEQRNIKLANCGIYVSKGNVLKEFVPKIDCNNAQKEYYLTDLIKLYNGKVGLYQLSDKKYLEIYNINNKQQLEFVKKQINN